MKDHVGSTCATRYPHTRFDENSVIAFSLESEGLPFDVDEVLHQYNVRHYIHTCTSVHPYRQCDK